jgi:hypothetical protein
MTKSDYAAAVDQIQRALRPMMTARGYKVRGRTFNRQTEDGLTQVVNLQMGPSDPPGTTYVPGLRENLHGLFTINLGVYVPEVARIHEGGEARSWVQEYHCSVRARLGETSGAPQGSWWHARPDEDVIQDVRARLERVGFPFLDRFATRDKILSEWAAEGESLEGAAGAPRIVMAIILAERGERERARALLARQVLETRNPGHPDCHPDYVRALAARLALGPL